MTAGFQNRHPRAFAATVISAIAAGLVALLVLQVLVPYLLGPAGLFLILAFDVSLYLGIRHRLRHPPVRRRSLIVWGPVDKRYAARRRDALEGEFIAGFAFAVFGVILYAVGFALRVEFWWLTQNWPLYIVGGVMTNLAIFLSLAREPTGSAPTESERFDTTEDH